jgi:hypothetical protein
MDPYLKMDSKRPLALCEPGVSPKEQVIAQNHLSQSVEKNQDLKKRTAESKHKHHWG